MLFCLSIYQKKLALRSPRSLRLEGKSAARKSYPQLREHLKHIKACILLAEDNSILLCTGKSVKQANGVDPSPLLSTAEATSVVLCPALGYPVQGRHWLIEASTESQSWLRDQSIRYIMRGSCTSHRLFGWNFNYFFIIMGTATKKKKQTKKMQTHFTNSSCDIICTSKCEKHCSD